MFISAEQRANIAETTPAGGNWRHGIHGHFHPINGEHEGNGQGIPEIIWPGPPSPGLEPTPMDHVIMEERLSLSGGLGIESGDGEGPKGSEYFTNLANHIAEKHEARVVQALMQERCPEHSASDPGHVRTRVLVMCWWMVHDSWGQPKWDRLLYMTGDEVQYHRGLSLDFWGPLTPLTPSPRSNSPIVRESLEDFSLPPITNCDYSE
ncbi:hypothetical protein BDV93DRAFT_509706 [Ceratobasidium sp. AG-I]|nr:hypothetical protein BDV93DRAFT_509706 [Ceratobasidium sp. AG-I]